jgi:hypothetical protein
MRKPSTSFNNSAPSRSPLVDFSTMSNAGNADEHGSVIRVFIHEGGYVLYG